jgi:hypothetical protein
MLNLDFIHLFAVLMVENNGCCRVSIQNLQRQHDIQYAAQIQAMFTASSHLKRMPVELTSRLLGSFIALAFLNQFLQSAKITPTIHKIFLFSISCLSITLHQLGAPIFDTSQILQISVIFQK